MVGVLDVGVWDDAGRLFAGLFADGVRAHAVGNEKKVAALLPLGIVGSQVDSQIILVVASADAHVGQAGMLDLIETCHRTNPARDTADRAAPSPVPCYTAASGMDSVWIASRAGLGCFRSLRVEKLRICGRCCAPATDTSDPPDRCPVHDSTNRTAQRLPILQSEATPG